MSAERDKQLATAKKLYASGKISAKQYQALTGTPVPAGLKRRPSPRVRAGKGATVAAGDGARAAARDATIIDQVHGDVYVGKPAKSAREALRIYRTVLAATTGQLPLRGLLPGASDPSSARPLPLADVYVALDTRGGEPGRAGTPDESEILESARPGRERQRPLSVLAAVAKHPRLVLLGDPGSGKSTFSNHLALVLCMHALEPKQRWLDRLPRWPKGLASLVPVLVVLRDFAAALPSPLPERAVPEHLASFIRRRLAEQKLAFAGAPLERALDEGDALVVFDGLDELPSKDQRLFVRDAVAAFVARFPKSRYLVTCRTLSYQPPPTPENEEAEPEPEPDLRLDPKDFPSFEIAPLDDAKIHGFIEHWYREVARIGAIATSGVAGGIAKLRVAVQRRDLARLAPNPLLLTVMALVHTHHGELPDARARLYEEAINILLWRWDQTRQGRRTPPIRERLADAQCTESDLLGVLSRLAFDVHANVADAPDGEAVADIGELDLIKALARLNHGDLNWAEGLVEAIKLRAGLLVERRAGVFAFPHRTFQEFLAGSHLGGLPDFAERSTRLVAASPIWREPVLLAVGRLVHVGRDRERPQGLIANLCPERVRDDEAGWKKVWFAGDVLGEIGVARMRGTELGQDLAARVQDRVVALLRGGKLSPRERAEAGVTLTRIGDPRQSVMSVDGLELIEIPAGPFLMGDEYHPLDLPSFQISKFPISNAQYAEFVEAGGYGEARYWKEAIAAKIWKSGRVTGWDGEPRDRPSRYRVPFGLANHPVVGITWYEALAFTRWLTERRCELGKMEPGSEVRLPSEAEWEKAARGGLELRRGERNDDPKREYPWRGDIDPQRANYRDAGIGATSAVGCFPGGASPYGVEEMSGNVWEWTRSAYRDVPYDPADGREKLDQPRNVSRVLRGGSYFLEAPYVRVAVRGRSGPGGLYGSIGFRVIVSSPSDSGP
ncbi:MAG: SUMF1/EgtB/PvdO family nonheme iron enzyme [bacterium]